VVDLDKYLDVNKAFLYYREDILKLYHEFISSRYKDNRSVHLCSFEELKKLVKVRKPIPYVTNWYKNDDLIKFKPILEKYLKDKKFNNKFKELIHD